MSHTVTVKIQVGDGGPAVGYAMECGEHHDVHERRVMLVQLLGQATKLVSEGGADHLLTTTQGGGSE